MTATTIRVQMAQRKDTAANWTAANPILLSGEIGYETDTKKFKIGDGTTNWNSLAYLPIPDGSGNLTVTGNLEIGSTGSLTFEGSTADGFETTLAVTDPSADRTITLPNVSGTVVTTGDTGSITSTMIADGTIVDGDINASAAIAGTKISPDFGIQNVVTTGTSTAASFIPTSSTVPTNGVYLPSANNVAISTNAAPRLHITSDGKLGLGTSSPGSKLEVKGDSNSSRVHISNTDAGASSFDGSGPGLLLTAGNMNATSKFTPGILFGSTDSDFTTTNPKVLAAINGVAGQVYATDTAGGMELAFYTTPDNQSTGNDVQERLRIDKNGRLLVGTSSNSGGALLQVNGDRIRVGTAKTPASATATGTAGEICWDANYVYVCTATNTWKRSALSTW